MPTHQLPKHACTNAALDDYTFSYSPLAHPLHNIHCNPQPDIRVILSSNDPITSQLDAYHTTTFEQCTERQKQIDSDKGTTTSYPCHVTEYEDFWCDFPDQEQTKNNSMVHILPYPINATKVALFLEYLIECPQVGFYYCVSVRN